MTNSTSSKLTLGVHYDVRTSINGDTVWVDGPDGSCVGRFSKTFGIDIHRPVKEQIAGLDQCLQCTHEPAGVGEWRDFVAGMLEHHGLVIPEGAIRFDG